MLTARKLPLLTFKKPSPILKPKYISITTPATQYPRATPLFSHQHSAAQIKSFTINSSKATPSARSIATMAGTSSFNDTVVQAMRELYPEELADKSWDNTGLLLDQAPSFSEQGSNSKPTVLLTNDLTKPVVDEALKKGASVIICYHPIIFKPLKSLTTKDPMQAQLLRLIAAGVSVYCPHTAVDAAVGGLNDWLCDILIDGDKEVKRAVAEPITRPLSQSLQGQEVGYGRVFELSQSITLQTLLKRSLPASEVKNT
ncbi:hypothetical protein NPX13_g1411 [Xylaria arbuscula]|uniref:Uncharacterized protein n=1 Tax=Xylaria arbuscula TaxID=114810 RepID=A0A9W8NM46_9PEZI|nr:hypothetical protein NPX13_g1411 [Xylaria arbuscula]